MVRIVVLVVVFGLAAAFVLLNWAALATPVTLSLGFGPITTTFGLLMLALFAVLGIAFGAWAMSMLAESHRSARALEAQRELADKAEASRFTELRGTMHDELRRVTDDLRIAMEQNTNTLAAHLGVIEERLERGGIARTPAVIDAGRGSADARLPIARER